MSTIETRKGLGHCGLGTAILLSLMVLLAPLLAGCGSSGGGGGGSSEGSSEDNPASATVGEPLEGTIGAGESFYSTFTTDSAGDYDIDLTGDDLSWTLYDDSSYTALDASPRSATVKGCSSGSCTAEALDAGTDYSLEIQNSGDSDEDFSLTVDNGGEGTAADPIVLSGGDGSRFKGTVGRGNSYYKLALDTTDANWLIMVSGSKDSGDADLEGNLAIYVYDDLFDTLQHSSDNSGKSSESVVPGFTSDTFYLKVSGSQSQHGSTFYIYTVID